MNNHYTKKWSFPLRFSSVNMTKSTGNFIFFVQGITGVSKNVRAGARIAGFSKTAYLFYYHAKPQVSCTFRAAFRVDGVCEGESIPITLASLKWSIFIRLNSVIQFTKQWLLNLSNWRCHLLSSITFYLQKVPFYVFQLFFLFYFIKEKLWRKDIRHSYKKYQYIKIIKNTRFLCVFSSDQIFIYLFY